MLHALAGSQTISSGSVGETEGPTAAIWIIRIVNQLSANAGQLELIADQCRMSKLLQVERTGLD